MLTWDWLGGFTDGEGCFGVMVYFVKCRGRLEIQPCYSIANTDIKIVIDVATFLNVRHWHSYKTNPRWNDSEQILVTHKAFSDTVIKLYPHLHCEAKRKAARLAWIMFYFKRLHSMKKEPLLTIEFLAKLTQKIRETNKRGKEAYYKWGYREIMNFYTLRVFPDDPEQVIFAKKSATPKLIQKAKSLRLEGKSYLNIGKELGVSKTAAKQWCLFP